MKPGASGSLAQNNRSPGWARLGSMRGPARYSWAAVRGTLIPAERNDHPTRPEQSNESGPVPPQRYGRPTRLVALVRIVDICAGDRNVALVSTIGVARNSSTSE